VYDGAGAGLDWSPLGGNPVPGDPGQVRGLASRFDQIADEVGVQVSRLRRVAEDMGGAGVWAGPAAEACRPHLDKLPGLLDKVVVSYRKAGGALAGYAPKLSAAQGKAVHALRMATEALSEQASAQTAARHKLTSSNGSGKDADPPPAGMLLATLVAADPGVQAAGDKLQKAHDLASEAAGDRDRAASTCSDGIHSASDAGIQNPGFFQSIGNDIAGGFEHAWDFAVDAFHYVKDHWVDIVKAISDIASKLSAVFGVLALATFWIPGVGEVFGAAALITGGVALAADTTLAATGHGQWSRVGMDAVAVAAGGMGRALGTSARLLRTGARGEKLLAAGARTSRSGSRLASKGAEEMQGSRMFRVVSIDRNGAATVDDYYHANSLAAGANKVRSGESMIASGRETQEAGSQLMSEGETRAGSALRHAGAKTPGDMMGDTKLAGSPRTFLRDAQGRCSQWAHADNQPVLTNAKSTMHSIVTGEGNPAAVKLQAAGTALDAEESHRLVKSSFFSGGGGPEAAPVH
jgi:hypothetical protein